MNVDPSTTDVCRPLLDWPKQIAECQHEKVKLVKSFYSDEMVQRGQCPECGVHLLELD